jgi:FMN phosphatase YigB (HAD superfamily)
LVQAVVMGIGGVLSPWAALADAEVDAAAAWLERRGFEADGFVAAARRRHGEPAWLGRALADAGVRLDLGARRELVLRTRTAPPRAQTSPHRGAIAALGRSVRVAALDSGLSVRMEAWVQALGLADVFRHRLWTEDLGLAARPPRPLAFRFIARQLDLRPVDCLYVAGHPTLAAAAQRAGFQVVALAAPAAPDFDWDTLLPTPQGASL